MNFVKRLSDGTLSAGEFFGSPPRLEIRDRGGNLLHWDSSSAMRVSIYDNPHGATLAPIESTFVVAKNGTVTFTSLQMDRAGRGFRLIFELFSWSDLTNKYTNSGVNVLSEYFALNLGPARYIETLTPAGFAWAGGQEFEVQPVLRIVDGGGNPLKFSSDEHITASSAASLSSYPGTRLSVDTRDAINSILDIIADVPSGAYGVGQEIIISVVFKYEVWWLQNKLGLVEPPKLALSISNSISGYSAAYAILIEPCTKLTIVPFLYTIQQGDTSASLKLTDASSLILSAADYIVDGNSKVVNLALPISNCRLVKFC